jgi:hypothetical protein
MVARIGDIKITGRIGLITDSVGNLYIDEASRPSKSHKE